MMCCKINLEELLKAPPKRADGGIRTLVPRRANAFRVRPVMTASIRLHLLKAAVRKNGSLRIIRHRAVFFKRKRGS